MTSGIMISALVQKEDGVPEFVALLIKNSFLVFILIAGNMAGLYGCMKLMNHEIYTILTSLFENFKLKKEYQCILESL